MSPDSQGRSRGKQSLELKDTDVTGDTKEGEAREGRFGAEEMEGEIKIWRGGLEHAVPHLSLHDTVGLGGGEREKRPHSGSLDLGYKVCMAGSIGSGTRIRIHVLV